MTSKALCIFAVLLVAMPEGEAGADFLVYKLGTKGQKRQSRGQGTTGIAQGSSSTPRGPGVYGAESSASDSGREIVLDGLVKKDGGKIMYSHPEVGEPLIFQANQVEIKHAATTKMEFNKMMAQAGKDPEAVLRAAVWALKKGLFGEFQHGIEKVLALDPHQETARRIRDLKKQIGEPLPDQNNVVLEKNLRNIVKAPGMHIETSNHFILLHDTEDKAEHGRHLNRAKERLRLLEQMYEKFVLLFEAQGVDLDLPHERFMVVLFKKLDDFQDCATRLGSRLGDVAGFWDPLHNITCFYDNSTTPQSRDLREERDGLEKIATDAKKKGWSLEKQRDSETLRQIKINSVLIEIDRWRSDMAYTSRETVHQFAASTGLLPPRVGIPRWVHLGMATYFESPSDEAWGGVGAVDDVRIENYRALQNDRMNSNIDFIIEDRSLNDATTRDVRPKAAAQVWSLTHFLFENHPRELMTYYKVLGDMPRDVTLNPDLLGNLFSRAFGPDHQALQQEWHGYMRTLKSDIERMEDAGENGD